MNEKQAGGTGNEDRVMDESSRQKGLGDEGLRALLRRADPADDGHEPSPREIAAWRQAMLAEAHGRSPGRGRFLWQGALATAGLVLLTVLIMPFLRSSSDVPQAPEIVDRGEPVTADPVSPAIPAAGALTASNTMPPAGPETDPRPAHEPVAPARTIQFTAPGGTRIIWKLDPGFKLPQEGEKT